MLADATALPPDGEHTRHFSEHLVLLPGSYQPQDESKRWTDSQGTDDSGHYVAELRQALMALADPSVSAVAGGRDGVVGREVRQLLRSRRRDERLRLLQMHEVTTAGGGKVVPRELVDQTWFISFNRMSKVGPLRQLLH